jgi:hypothetical protein
VTSTPTIPRPRRRMAIATLLKRATSTASSRHGIGGKLKERHAPRAITLPTIMAMALPPDHDEHNHRGGVSSADGIVGRERS